MSLFDNSFFEALTQRGITPQVFTYGKGSESATVTQEQEQESPPPAKRSGRDSSAQQRYREKLLEECPYCPITKISDERLLVASHIKPCAVSEENDSFDSKNGFILSPLYDRLFDQGFVTFDEKKCMVVSNWISPSIKSVVILRTAIISSCCHWTISANSICNIIDSMCSKDEYGKCNSMKNGLYSVEDIVR